MLPIVVIGCLIIESNAIEFSPHSCGVDGTYADYTFDGTEYTFISRAPAYSRCRISTDITIPWSLDYTITMSLQNKEYSRPGIFFNIHDNNNYEFIFFKTLDSDCVMPGIVSDSALQNYQAPKYNTYCGNYIDDDAWFNVVINVTSSQYNVSVNNWPALTFKTARILNPSLGLIHGIGSESSCGYNCHMNVYDISLLPLDHILITKHDIEGSLPTPGVGVTVFRINIDNAGHPGGTYCILSFFLEEFSVGRSILSIQGNTEHTKGAFETYTTSSPYLDVMLRAVESPLAFNIQYKVIQCGFTEKVSGMDFLCASGNHIDLQEDYHRSMANKVDEGHSDSALPRGWYRFSSCAGDSIPTTSPGQEGVCGASYPIWIKDEILEIACVFKDGNECAEEFRVPIFHCPDYNLYYLTPTNVNTGYCAGTRHKCDISMGEVSDDGCGPCRDGNVPDVTLSIGDWESKPDGHALSCHVNGPQDSDEVVLYHVQWRIDFKTHHSTIQDTDVFVTGENHKLHSSSLRNEYLQNNIYCRIKARYEGKDPGDWVESEQFFIGIQVVSSPNVITKETGLLEIKLTAPISTSGEKDCDISLVFATTSDDLQQQTWCENSLSLPPEIIHHDSCAHTIKCSDWKWPVVHPIHVKNTVVKLPPEYLYYNHTVTIVAKSEQHALWNNIHTRITVPINYESMGDATLNSTCRSYNDPHIITFRNIKYDVHRQGEYIMYKTKPEAEPDMQVLVTAQFEKCYKDPRDIFCNVAVGVRVKSEAVVIDARVSPPETYIGPGYGERGFRVTLSDKVYGFYLPRGEKVVVEIQKQRVNLKIYSLLEEQRTVDGQSGGLCGRIGKGNSPGLMMPSGKDLSQKVTKGDILNDYAWSWRAKEEDAIINLENDCLPTSTSGNTASNQKHVYSCQLRTARELLAVSADHIDLTLQTRNVDRCIRKGELHKLDDWRGLYGHTSCAVQRKKRQTVKFRRSYVNDRNKRSQSVAWSNATSYAYCNEQISDSSTGQACDKLTPEAVTDSVEMCVADIMLTNSTEWTSGTLSSLREECINTLLQRPDLWLVGDNNTDTNNTELTPPSYIMDGLCPNDCTDRGICVDGFCRCEPGFISSDCSLSVETPPSLLKMISGNVCSYNENCGQILIVGDDYVAGDSLMCHFSIEQQHLSTTDSDKANTNIDIQGSLISYDVINCTWPINTNDSTGFTTLSVTVSNDGIHESESLTEIAMVHSPCFACEDVSGEVHCYLEAGWCMIDGNCVYAQVASSIDDCWQCDPDINSTNWTKVSECSGHRGLPLSYIFAIVLGCVAILAIAAGIILMILSRCWRWKKVKNSDTGKVTRGQMDLIDQ